MNICKQNKGFTMVELIIVIAIIAVLSAVLAPQYLKFVEESRKTSDLNTATTLIDATSILAVTTDIDIPDEYIIVRWDTSSSSAGYGDGSGNIMVGRRNSDTQEQWMKDFERELRALLNLPSDASSIGDPQSDTARSQDLLFRVSVTTGAVELHRNYVSVWKEYIGLDVAHASF